MDPDVSFIYPLIARARLYARISIRPDDPSLLVTSTVVVVQIGKLPLVPGVGFRPPHSILTGPLVGFWLRARREDLYLDLLAVDDLLLDAEKLGRR